MKDRYKVIVISLGFGLFFWIADAILDFFFSKGILLESLIADMPTHKLFARSLTMICFLTFGILVSGIIARREQLEETIRENQERFRTMADFTYAWEYWFSPEGNLIYVSPSCKRITGYRDAEFVHDPKLLEKIVHPDDLAIVIGHMEEELEDSATLPVDFRIFTRDGQMRWIGHICQSIYDDDGNWLGKHVSNRDITGHKMMEETLWRRNKELAMLNSASRALISTLDQEQMLVIVLEEVRQLLDVSACSIWLVDAEMDNLVCQQATGSQGERVRGHQLSPGEGLAGWVVQNSESLLVSDAQTDERYFDGVAQRAGMDLRSILTVPLQAGQKVIGVLQAVDTKANHFNLADVKLLKPLAAAAAMAIENTQLYDQTRRDAETRAILLREVNHRVKNNLTGIIGMLYAARRRAKVENRETYQATMDNLIVRVRGLSTVHDMLSASGWAPLQLSDLATAVINATLRAFSYDKCVLVDVSHSLVRVTSDQAHNLALVINELAINAVKYAFGKEEREEIHIVFQITFDDGTVHCEFRDNGPGYPQDVLQFEHHKVGFDMIQNIVRKSLHGELSLRNDDGAVAVIQFKAKV
ncbi:MAG: GAF domain-containing protein [Chloroflexi bacterium]|nr:GAF domain-containing protein [Chloroflexota bacterium]